MKRSVVKALACAGLALAGFKLPAAATNACHVAKDYEEIRMRTTGGMIRRPGFGKGSVAVVSDQKRVSVWRVSDAMMPIESALHIKVEHLNGKLTGALPTSEDVKKCGSQFAIFLVDQSNQASRLITSPDARWAMINVAALSTDNPDVAKLEKRVRKEIVRAFGCICGAFCPKSNHSLFAPASTLKDLDNIIALAYPPDHYAKTIAYLRASGVEPYVERTYHRACREGWAPAPTNDIQKAIWDKVHEMPTAPLKIKPETKKVVE